MILIGKASRLSRYVTGLDKTYTAVARFGAISDTLDAEGEIVDLDVPMPSEEEIRNATENFTGEIEQTPPMASAVKVGGERLYDLHRKGITVERESRTVGIHSFELTDYDHAARQATLEISCTSGTYVRSLVGDLANSLNNGAYLTDLRRNSVGNLTVQDASKIESLNAETIDKRIIQPTAIVSHMPALQANAKASKDVSHGRDISAEGFVGSFRVEKKDRLLAIYRGDGTVAKPEVVLWAE